MRKRFLSLFCVLAFCLTLLSVTAWAAGPDWTYDPAADTLTWTDPDTSSTIILNNVTDDGERNLTIGSNTSFSGDLNLSGTISDSGNTTQYRITAIGDSAFYSCDSLKTVELPDSLKSIGDSAFAECYSLEKLDLSGCTSLESIGDGAFLTCYSLETVDLSGCTSLESIGDMAFDRCVSLETVDLSGCTSLESIGAYAFYACSLLKTLDLPASLASIGDMAFDGCASLTQIQVAAENQNFSAENGVLFDRNQTVLILYLQGKTEPSYQVPETVKEIRKRAFYNCDSLKTLDLPASLESIGDSAFPDCDSLETVDLSGCTSLESIGDGAFSDCVSLETVDLPASLESIGAYAFLNCTSLETVDLRECTSLESIGDMAFDRCGSLETLDLPASLESIGDRAFNNCTKLETVYLPASLASIGDRAFNNCSNLAELVVLAETPPTLGSDSLTTDNTSLRILVPAACVETYRKANGWSSFDSMIARLSCNLTVTPDNDSQVLLQGEEPQPVIFTVIRQEGTDDILFSFPVSSLQISLTDGAPFELGLPAMDTVLAPNGKTTFTVALQDGLEPGKYQITIQLNSAFLAQPITASLTCTVKAVENSEIQANPDSLDFGSKTAGYTQAPAAQTVTLTNTGNQTVTVTLPTSTNYTMTAGAGFAGDTATLAPNGTAAFTVQPKIGLAIGTYSETLTISGANQTEASFTANFTVVPRNSGGGHATTSNPQYAVTVLETENGSIRVSPERAKEGDRVKVTAVPQTGYALDSLTVTDTDGKTLTLHYMETNVYTFEMPKGEAEISAVFAPATAQPTQPIISFIDVQPNHWFYDAVCYVVEHGLMHGMSDDTFSPNTPLQREMFAVILWNLEGNPAPEDVAIFLDVTSDKYYAEAIAWANENGIAAGYGDTFGVGESITREQFAVMLHNYAQYKGYDVSVGEDTNILSYTDAFDISNYAYPAMQWACGAGIMSGNDDGTLNPQGQATRAEAATMLMNFCENAAE